MDDARTIPVHHRKLAAGAFVALAVAAFAISCGGGGDNPGAQVSSEEAASSEEAKPGAGSVVTLGEESLRLAAIEISLAAAAGGSELLANGTIAYDANRVSLVAPRAEGRVTAVRTDLGQAVHSGTVLAILESPEIGESRGQVERARANLEVAKQTSEREASLFEQHVSSKKEMLEARAAYLSAQADYDAAQASARALGASASSGSAAGGSYPLVSPIAGTVVERNATPGQIVGPENPLFTVADLRSLWIDVDVYEADADRVHRAARATVVTRALPGTTFVGRVTYAGGIVDPGTRTVKMRVEVDNAEGRLRPGMYAEVRIEAPLARSAATTDEQAVVVPELAVQDLAGEWVVFVPGEAAGKFVARGIALGPRLPGGLVTITSGLRPGERVVTRGAFQLKSELLEATFGENE